MIEPENTIIKPLRGVDVIDSIHDKKVYPPIWKCAYKGFITDKLVKTTKPFYCNMGEDVYFSHILFTFGSKIGYLDDVLYHYQRDTGMSSPDGAPDFDPGRFRRYLKDAVEASEHTIAFIREHNPQKLDATKEAMINIAEFVVLQHVFYEKDYKNVIRYISEIDRMGFEELYDHVCNVMLKKMILFQEGYLQDESDKIV